MIERVMIEPAMRVLAASKTEEEDEEPTGMTKISIFRPDPGWPRRYRVDYPDRLVPGSTLVSDPHPAHSHKPLRGRRASARPRIKEKKRKEELPWQP